MYEHCGQRDLKEHFDSFCEDYNTATMPSKKYYNIQVWHAAEQAKGRKKKVRDARAHHLLAVYPHDPTTPPALTRPALAPTFTLTFTLTRSRRWSVPPSTTTETGSARSRAGVRSGRRAWSR